MSIDIDHLSEQELHHLNHRIVERLRFLKSMRAHREMMNFNRGEKVSFEAPGLGRQFGTLVRYNKKTVTVITDDGHRWNVSPHALSHVKNVNTPPNTSSNKVIEFNPGR